MPLMKSWVSSANSPETDFPLNNLPCGVFSRGGEDARCGVAIGDAVLDIALRFRIHGLMLRLEEMAVPGVIEMTPGIRSLQIHYRPEALGLDELGLEKRDREILEVLILLSALGALYTGSQALRQTVGEDPFLYLKLLTTAQDPLPSFVGFLSFFIPLAAIALAFDAVNGEYARGTLSRVLSQPIYRDALLFGKFLAGLGTLALLLFALFLMVVGLGLLRLGVPPGSEEVGRAFFFLLATLGYAGVWLALGLLFSVLFRQPATAALAALGVWLFFAVFYPILTDLAATALKPALQQV